MSKGRPKGRRSFAVDKQGYYHLRHPTKQGLTRCRRPTKHMVSSFDPTAMVDCEACRELIRLDVRREESPYKEPEIP